MVQAVAAAVPVRIVRRRRETPEQWYWALERALAEALDLLTEPRSGRTFVESGTTPGVLYEVTQRGCSCKAGESGLPCKHRACLLAQLGVLPLDADPAPAVVAIPATREIACLFCYGTGRIPNLHREQFEPCSMCGGAGRFAPDAEPEALAA